MNIGKKITMGQNDNLGHVGGGCGRDKGSSNNFLSTWKYKTRPSCHLCHNKITHQIICAENLSLWKRHCRIIERSKDVGPKKQ